MSKKIFRSTIFVTIIVLVLCLVITNGFLYSYFNSTQVDSLKNELSLTSIGVEQNGIEYLKNIESTDFRLSLISPSGEVIYDSLAEYKNLDNHSTREEVSEAFENGTGSSARYSKTLTEKTFYEAVRLTNGNVLRISATQVTIAALLIKMLPVIVAIVLFSVAVAVIMSKKMAKSIVKPLEELDLENPERNETYEELTPLLTKLNRQHKQILSQMQELKQKSEEFIQLTSTMNEGLIVLDKSGVVLSINNTAKYLFNTDDFAIGKNYYVLNRTPSMTKAVDNALIGKHTEFREQKNGGEYQFLVNPTVSNGVTTGVIILCIDVTETAFAEQNRQEFTANVSHELKTPLQSIIGSAELLENGLVKPEDTERFVKNIKKEAKRLVELINDIIRLSQLDEQTALTTEDVDLYQLSAEVINALSLSAEQNNVSLKLSGTNCVVKGVRSLFYETVYNLCDNAIRYNKPNGKVEISVASDKNNTVLTVSDTGIGISAEHQSRIFERFYRVDKSHSKQTGGTGLGLSIVKHAVACNGGTIKLSSAVNKGTVISVIF